MLLRSRDGGATWDTLPEARPERCLWVVPMLEAHPTDGERLFLSTGCLETPGIMAASLLQSVDQGASWSALSVPRFGVARRMVGGQGAMPGRFYLDMSYSADIATFSSAILLRSDDDGVTWDEVSSKRGTEITGLAYDAHFPEWVYVSLRHGGVLASRDDGRTWSPAARSDIGEVSDLVIPLDTRDLYAATRAGVWALRLPI